MTTSGDPAPPSGAAGAFALPTLPAVALEVLELARRSTLELDELATVLTRDPALAAKLLRTANSSYYGLGRPCSTIRQAIVLLGVNAVKTLALGFSLAASLERPGPDGSAFPWPNHWRSALHGACAAKLISEHLRTGDPEEAFLAALLRDVGAVLLHRRHGAAWLEVVEASGHDAARGEREAFGEDHAALGGTVARAWRLPDSIADAIARHDDAGADGGHPVRATALAELASVALDGDEKARTRFLRAASLGDEEADALLESISSGARELARILDVAFAGEAEAVAALGEAEVVVARFHAELDEERGAARERLDDLAAQALADPLTGLANRRRFDQELATLLDHARRFRGPLALMLADFDHFKRINDLCGHPAGDEALISAGRIITDEIGERGTVARYGGEEIAVILPGFGLRESAALAERLRTLIEEARFGLVGLDGTPFAHPITISVGVAAYEPSGPPALALPAAILRVADRALYAAKQQGRNVVQVFNPARSRSA